LALIGIAPAHAQGQAVDQTCVLPLTDLDEGATNTLYPDDSAAYFSGAFTAVPGTEIRLTGRSLRLRPGRSRVVVNLRGRRPQTVRVRFRLRSGRTVTRSYRTCVPRRTRRA